MLVGGGWLAVNVFMATVYAVINRLMVSFNMPAQSTRDSLTRERLAEEEINRLGRLSRTLNGYLCATNAFASVQLLSNAKADTTSRTVDILALGASFFPLLFTNHWEDVAQEQQQYKKNLRPYR